MTPLLITIIKAIAATGLINVWIFRFNKKTPYRGGNACSMVEEFAEYGLPNWFCYFVGFLKLSAALMLLASIWNLSLTLPAASLLLILMLGAISMHVKVKDPIKKSLPASAMLMMALSILL